MNFAQYTPTTSTVVAVQWPKNPTVEDQKELQEWVGNPVMMTNNQATIFEIWEIEKRMADPGDFIVRDDDGFHIYTEEEFNNRFTAL